MNAAPRFSFRFDNNADLYRLASQLKEQIDLRTCQLTFHKSTTSGDTRGGNTADHWCAPRRSWLCVNPSKLCDHSQTKKGNHDQLLLMADISRLKTVVLIGGRNDSATLFLNQINKSRRSAGKPTFCKQTPTKMPTANTSCTQWGSGC